MAKLRIEVENGKREMLMVEAAGTAPDLTAMLAAAVEEFTYRTLVAAVEEFTYRTLVAAPNSVIEIAAKAEANLLAKAIKNGLQRAAEEITASQKAGETK